MRKDDLGFGYRETRNWRIVMPMIVVAVLLAVVIGILVKMSRDGGGPENEPVISAEVDEGDSDAAEDTEDTADTKSTEGVGGAQIAGDVGDPQDALAGGMTSGEGASVDVTALLAADGTNELSGRRMGIDVAKYQGTIDWAQVAGAGVEFAMVRVGYRTMETGEICEDTNARYNMQEAQANGVKVGAYFFSTAVTVEEAVEEADWVADMIAQYRITYPVAYNCEGFTNPESRQYHLTQSERTDIADAFLKRIYERGYTPMFYAAKNEMEGDAQWDASRLRQSYKLWMAWYPDDLTPMDEGADSYADGYAMWQYTSKGSVAGISQPVDVNVAYFTYEGAADAKSDIAPESVDADVEALMKFTEVNETVTAKEKTNLRDIPSQGDDSTVQATLANGETATRTGVSDSGWSRIVYNGQTCYAVSSYLTTDLNYRTPGTGAQADDGNGLKTKFTEVNDSVTAKIEVNLRTMPSVTHPDSAVVAVLHNGEVVTRTGINDEYGWSRVEYNGQTLYCISSYLTGA